MNNFLLSVGFLLALVLAVLFAGPHFVDWNQYRHTFEVQASRVVGREVRVGGKVSLRLLPTPFLKFENVRIADQDGRFAEPFLKMKSFTMLLSVPPLLKGDVEASGIKLDRPRFHLVIDDEQGPNWKGLGAGQLAFPVAPKSVAFKSITVSDGQLVLKVSGDKKILEYNRIYAELSAAAIAGPYKLSGTYRTGGSLRQVTLATGTIEADGSVPVKSRLINPKNGMTYSFDGNLRNAGTDPVFEGKLNAVLPVNGAGFAPTADGTAPVLASTAQLDARIKGDVREFKLDDLTIAFESEGRPQSLRGQAKLDWQDGLALNADLRAIWLDLDRIAGFGGKKVLPWSVLRSLLKGFEGNWPSADKIDVEIAVDQATLGGDVINSLVAQLYKSERELRLKTLTAALPGTSHIRMSGQIVEGKNTAFIGDVTLRGRSFTRFRRWAMHDFLETAKGDDGYFALRGLVDASNENLTLTRLRGEYAKTVFTGRASTQFGDNAKFNIVIDSDKIDLRKSLEKNVTIRTLADLIAGYSSALSTSKKAQKTEDGIVELQRFNNGRLALKVGQLLLPNESFRDVDVDLTITPSRVDLARVQLETFSGARLEIDGNIDNTAEIPVGRLNVLLDAPRLDAVRSVAGMLDLPGGMVDIDTLSPELAPVRLAGVVKFGTRDGRSMEASLDGSMGTTRSTLLLRLDGKPSQWRSGQVDVVGFLKSEDGPKLLAQLFSSRSDQITPTDLEGVSAPGRLALRMSGVPNKGMVSVVDLEAPGMRAEYRGSIGLVQDKMQMEGEFFVDALRANTVFSLIGLEDMLSRNQRHSLNAKGLVIGEGGVFQLSEFDVRLGNTDIKGEGSVEFGENGAEVKLVAKLARLSLPELLNGIVAAKTAVTAPQPVGNNRRSRSVSEPEFSWPDQPFDFALFKNISGWIDVSARKIILGQGMAVSSGQMVIDFDRDRLNFKHISGALGGGKFAASLDLKRGAAGVTGRARTQLRGVDLRRFRRLESSGDTPRNVSVAQGKLDLDLDVEGRGLSPRGIVSVLKGSGVARFQGLSLMHFSPEAVEVASNAMLQARRKPDKDRLEAAIIANLEKGVLRVGTRNINLKVADGTVTLARQRLKKPATELVVTTYVDLNRLLLDSEWIIKPKVKIKAALQPVSILYNGSIRQLRTLRPRIDAEQLSRELVVRKLELDVEALESLRRRDDELARQAEIALKEQSADWGVTETIKGDGEGDSEGVQNDASGAGSLNVPVLPRTHSRATQTDTRWQSDVTPYGPYGSAYEPLEKAAPKLEPPPKPAPAKRRVRVYKKKVKKKNVFQELFNF